MERFIFGRDCQFLVLKKALQDGLCHIYRGCSLPPGFNRQMCKIGFEKCLSDHHSYKILTDRNIKYVGRRSVSPLLQIFLETGELTFLDFNDLKEFLQSLGTLYF